MIASRLIRIAGGLAVLGIAVCAACSATTRHRVVSFFFDGVPPLEAPSAAGAPTPEGPAVDHAEGVEPAPAPIRYFAHTPYRDNRCGGCHDVTSGGLVRSIEEGLCLSCHATLVTRDRFVHGPVAVNDCTVCHHFHTSPFPNLLLKDPVATCLECHERTDLSAGEHHAAIERQSCVECHNPHGGDDRFFLKRSQP